MKESQNLGPLLSPGGSCQHQLSFLGHVPWYLQHQEVSGNSDSGLGLDCLACQGWELLLTLFQVGLGQVILEVSGERDVLRQEAFRCLLSFDLDLQGEGFRLQPVGVAESLQAIRSKPLNVQKGKLRPREGTQQTPVGFPLSYHICAVSGSQSNALQGLSAGDREAGMTQGASRKSLCFGVR